MWYMYRLFGIVGWSWALVLGVALKILSSMPRKPPVTPHGFEVGVGRQDA
jgi:hypothetical protein